MNILVIGGGGREHALVSQYAKSKKTKKIYSIPGNRLMKYKSLKPVETYKSLNPSDKDSILKIVKREKIDLVDVAQDAPIADGLVDFLEEGGIAALGPSRKAAEIEWNKEWSREFMKKFNLPIPNFAVFSDPNSAKDYIDKLPGKSFFVKASGLAAGKGAIKADSKEEGFAAVEYMKSFGKAGKTFLVEECLEGEEVSVYVLADGKNFKILHSAQDNKTVNNFDEGPNTGGMGAHAPADVSSGRVVFGQIQTIVKKTILGLEAEGRPYKGVLYVGLIIDKNKKVSIIEFNARWGDPEAQVVLPAIKTDFVDIARMCIDGNLRESSIKEDSKIRVCVVGSSRGYPQYNSAVIGKKIFGLEEASKRVGVTLFGAGIEENDGRFIVSGGRVLNVVGEGKDLLEARARAYEAISLINIEGNNLHYRTDIGWRDMERIYRR